MSSEDWPTKVLIQTEWTIAFVLHHFKRQVENKFPVSFLIKTDLSLFKENEFKKAIIQLIYSGVKKGDLKDTMLVLRQTCAECISLWNNYLSKMDKVRRPPPGSSQLVYTQPLLPIEIIDTLQGFTIYEKKKFPIEEGVTKINQDLVKFSSLILKSIEDLEEAQKLRSIFPSDLEYQICLDLMEFLEITLDGKSILKKGRAGSLFPAIDAMRDAKNFMKTWYTQEVLLSIFNGHLGTDYTTFSKKNKEYETTYGKARDFLAAKRPK